MIDEFIFFNSVYSGNHQRLVIYSHPMSNSSTSSLANNQGPWWRDLTPYHWFVFAMASLAWLFDCLDQQIFSTLPPTGSRESPSRWDRPYHCRGTWWLRDVDFCSRLGDGRADLLDPSGDKHGRAKMLTLTVLLYSVFTGLSALSKGWIDFAIFTALSRVWESEVFLDWRLRWSRTRSRIVRGQGLWACCRRFPLWATSPPASSAWVLPA